MGFDYMVNIIFLIEKMSQIIEFKDYKLESIIELPVNNPKSSIPN